MFTSTYLHRILRLPVPSELAAGIRPDERSTAPHQTAQERKRPVRTCGLPAKTPLPETPPAVDALQQVAVQSRPDLFAQQWRIRTECANLALACKEYYPDVSLVAKYDGFMPEEMRPQVGIDVNVPMRYARRSAAEREAADRLQQRCAEYQNLLDQTRWEVQSAFDRSIQSEQIVHLFEEKILPAAQRSLDSCLSEKETAPEKSLQKVKSSSKTQTSLRAGAYEF